MFENRARGREILDDVEGAGAGSAFARASYRTMARVNRRLGCARAVRDFVIDCAGAVEGARPLRVLDMGAGDGALAIDTLRWVRRCGLRVTFTCVEPNPVGLGLARERLSAHPDVDVTLAGERIEEHRPAEPYDCAVGTLFFHHFEAPEILRLLRRLSTYVRQSVLINDLRRGPVPFVGFLLLSPVLPSLVCRDGVMSIRRGFTPRGLNRLLARLPEGEARVCGATPFRVTARVNFAGPTSPAQ